MSKTVSIIFNIDFDMDSANHSLNGCVDNVVLYFINMKFNIGSFDFSHGLAWPISGKCGTRNRAHERS